MTIKLPFKFIDLEDDRAPDLNEALNGLYKSRIESVNKRENTGVNSFIYQSIEHGEVFFSANGSALSTLSFGFKEKQSKIIYAIRS